MVDTTLEEAMCVSCRVMVAVNEDGHLCGFTKEGRGGISAALLNESLTVSCVVQYLNRGKHLMVLMDG